MFNLFTGGTLLVWPYMAAGLRASLKFAVQMCSQRQDLEEIPWFIQAQNEDNQVTFEDNEIGIKNLVTKKQNMLMIYD